VIYIWKTVEVLYLKEPDEATLGMSEVPISMLVPIWILAIACIFFGLNTEWTLSIADVAASGLLNGGGN
jgi:multicomponent Na+:H+ antiporter subunit D